MAATAIAEAGTDAQKQALLPGIASGATIAALAAAEPGTGWNADAFAATARADNGSWRLAGRKSYVLDGMAASLVVAAARLPDGGLGLFSLPAESEGLARQPLQSMDPTRRLAQMDFDGAQAELLGGPEAGGPAWARTLDIAAVCLAGEMGRRRGAAARGRARICLHADAVRPLHRLLPGHKAQGGGHAAGGRAGESRRLLCRRRSR